MIDLREEASLPWCPDHPYQGEEQPRAGRQWRHTVYFGVLPLGSVQNLLEERFGRDDEGTDDYTPGDTELFAFEVFHGATDPRPRIDDHVRATEAFEEVGKVYWARWNARGSGD